MNEDYWRESYSEDIVWQLPNQKLVGREACRQHILTFVESLNSAPKIASKSLAFDEQRQTSIHEFQNDFSHNECGEVSQMQIHVQRWRDNKIYEEVIYVIPHS